MREATTTEKTNLAPFEILICWIVTIPSAFAGVYLAFLLKRV